MHVGVRHGFARSSSGALPVTDPGFHLTEIPHYATRSEIETTWKLAALL